MFTINRDDSCYAFGFINYVPDTESIMQSMSDILQLRNGIDVIVAKDNLDNSEIFANAKLYIDILPRPSGVRLFIMICSAKIQDIITDWETFLVKLSHNLAVDIFIETDEKGYIFERSGLIKEVKYKYFYVDDWECLEILNTGRDI